MVRGMALLRAVTFLRQFLGAILAVLMANPACCCTLGNLLPDSKNDVPLSSCCSQKEAPGGNSQHERPEECPNCPCEESSSVLVETLKPTLAFSCSSDQLSLPPVETTTSLALLKRGVSSPTSSPLSVPSPSAMWRLHCCYLI